jgi:hypothetical protein
MMACIYYDGLNNQMSWQLQVDDTSVDSATIELPLRRFKISLTEF